MKRHSLILLAILILALGMRLINLGERNLWYDEAFAILFADQGLEAMLYGTLTPVDGGAADIHPLLYYTTLDGWMALFGTDVFAARLWSALLGVATVGMMVVLGRALFGIQTGLVAGFITAIAPFHVQYSQEARMYSLLALLLVTATWCFVRGDPSPQPPPRKRRGGANDADTTMRDVGTSYMMSADKTKSWRSWLWWVAFGVLAGLAMYAQQLAAFYLIAIGLVPIIARRRDWFIRVAVGSIIAVIVYLPWLVNLPGQLQKVGSYYWIPVPKPLRLLATIRAFFISALDIDPSAAVFALMGSIIVLVFLILQIGMRLRRVRREENRALLFVLWLFVAPPVLMWLISQLRPVYLERGLIASALMLYMLLGWLFTRGGLPRLIAGVIGVVLLALAGLGLSNHYTWDTFPNSPFRAAAVDIRADLQDGDVVIHQNKLSALPMRVYDRDLPQHYIADTPGSPEDTLALPTQDVLQFLADECVALAANSAERIWFVEFADAQRQYEAAGRDDLNATYEWLDAHYSLIETRSFNDLDVRLYADPDETAQAAGCDF